MNHLKSHWHHYLSLAGLILSTTVLSAGVSQLYTRYHGSGYVPGPLPPPVQIAGSPSLPSQWWLNRYLVRVHNQGNSNSCVGQTLSTMEEIIQHERDSTRARWHKRFSAGFIWNLINGGQNVGTSYQDAFWVLLNRGDARLRDFSPDGATQYWVRPGPTALRRAGPYRFATWRSIYPTDRTTIRYELRHGRPLAIAMPIYSSTYNHWRTSSWITGASGSFLFWHSMTLIGYNRFGVELMNSWGPDWGDGGHAMLTWDALAAAGAELVVAQPRKPIASVHIPKFNPKLPLKGPVGG